MAAEGLEQLPCLGKCVVPGDTLVERLPESGTVRVGSGVAQCGAGLRATKAGTVHRGTAGTMWVSSSQKRYIPNQNDAVIGIITQRHSELYMVDICGPCPAFLPALAFEGVARRNRPNLQVGDTVFCRVQEAARDLDPELSCVDLAGKAAGFGPLKGGTLCRVSTQFARQLAARPAFLAALGAALKFELAVGANGRVWVNAATPATAAAVCRVLGRAQGLEEREALELVQDALRDLRL